MSSDLVVAHEGTFATLLFLFLCVAAVAAAAQDEGEREVHLGVVHCAPKCHCKLLIQMTVTLADGSVLEADGDLLNVFSSSSFLILLVLVDLLFYKRWQNCQKISFLPHRCRRRLTTMTTKTFGRFDMAIRL